VPWLVERHPQRHPSLRKKFSFTVTAILTPSHESKRKLMMPTGTIRLHRVLRADPERVYRAFLDPEALVKWLPPYGFTCKVHHLDAKVGGTHKMSFTNFGAGQGHSFGGEYLELVPGERIRYTDRFDDPNLSGQMQTTVTFEKVSCGIALNVVQDAQARLLAHEGRRTASR
jgi:uncharacterized protein YndB with AHSA1/START domain